VLKTKRILVVDDDAAVRKALKFVLETEGLVVETYASGRELLAAAAVASADCLIVDCKMPEMDGFAVVAELSNRKITVPVILITSMVTEEVRRRARKAGISGLLEKPLLGASLADSIHRLTAS
jgi:FixJ family two-component response regulator